MNAAGLGELLSLHDLTNARQQVPQNLGLAAFATPGTRTWTKEVDLRSPKFSDELIDGLPTPQPRGAFSLDLRQALGEQPEKLQGIVSVARAHRELPPSACC